LKFEIYVNNVANVERPWNILEDGRVHSGFLNPRGVLSRWVLLDQRQGFVVAVEQVGSDEGDVPASENIEFDHICR
jgi:hypothetical protein